MAPIAQGIITRAGKGPGREHPSAPSTPQEQPAAFGDIIQRHIYPQPPCTVPKGSSAPPSCALCRATPPSSAAPSPNSFLESTQRRHHPALCHHLGWTHGTRASWCWEKIPAAPAGASGAVPCPGGCAVPWGLCHATLSLCQLGTGTVRRGHRACSGGPCPPALPPRTPRVCRGVISYACSVEIKHVLQNK